MTRRVNLVPMAGEGRRFADAGYREPKPLVPIDGEPMVLQAAARLPPADAWIFVCRTAHIREAHIDRVLTDRFAGAHILPVDHLTEGQASTCLLARDLLRRQDVLTIGACDNAMVYDTTRFASLLDTADVLVWTFRNNPAVLQNPRMYGWVDADGDGKVRRVSCKVPISDTPMDDHAVIGAFSYRRAGDFLQTVDAMVAANRRINNEFYMDEAMNVAVERGLNVRVFEVDRYICWGTPQDVAVYNYWASYFRRVGLP